MTSPFDHMTVTVPPGKSGDISVRRFTVGGPSLRDLVRSDPRMVPSGTYTGLYEQGSIWMSDTPAERRDHWPVVTEAMHQKAQRALINGLGLGMVVAALLHVESIKHIDIVEINPDVIALVGPHYHAMALQLGKTIDIHEGDAYTIRWDPTVRWDIAWSDIWPTACTDNLPGMTRLTRKYARRVGWHGHWLRWELLRHRREQRRRNR